MLCLNHNDVQRSITATEMIDAMASAMTLYESGEFHMPNRSHVNVGDNTLLLMPCFKEESFSTKLVTVFPENSQRNVPVIMGTVLLNDGKTGEPLSIMNGSSVTALRTAGVTAAGLRYLKVDQRVKNIGLIGAGAQGLHQAWFACQENPGSTLFVFDPFLKDSAEFKRSFAEKCPDVAVNICHRVENLLESCDVVITATTSFLPVLPDDGKILAGKIYLAVGSFKPEMRELPDALIKQLDQLFVDTDFAKTESGDVKDPLADGLIDDTNVLTMGKIISGEKQMASNSTRLFKTVGMALFDLIAAELIYKKAKSAGIGTEFQL